MIPRPTLALACTVLVGAVASFAVADDPAAPPADAAETTDAPKPDDGAKFFESLDVNGDGKLELKEVPPQARRRMAPLFRRVGKTSLTAAEFAKVRSEERAGDVEDDRARFFDKLDQNGDGRLTHAEAPEKAKRLVAALLERAGKPADGSLSKTEYVAVVTGKSVAEPESSEPDAPGLLGVLDANGDGKLDRSEIAAAAAKFAELDADGDGLLDSRELLGAQQDPTNEATGGTAYAQRVFTELDADGNGVITKEEAPELVREAFDQLDLDGNGLSFTEFTKAIEKKAAESSDEAAEPPAE